MKKLLLILLCAIIANTAFAFGGGGGGGGSHPTTRNADGVSSIGIKICGSLSCPDVIIKEGDCGNIEHSSQQYGVCTCDEGYMVLGGQCVPSSESNCQQAGEKWCSGLSSCVNSDDCCAELSLNDCQLCDSDTGAVMAKSEGLCAVSGTPNAGFCFAGECLNPCEEYAIDGCKTCVPQSGTGICQECHEGYTLSGNSCIANTCDTTNTSSVGSTAYTTCVTPTETYYICTECESGYTLDKKKHKCNLNKCDGWTITSPITGCTNEHETTCVTPSNTYYKCDDCESGYTLDNDTCVANTCDSTNTSIDGCSTYTSCITPTGTYYTCTACSDGYTLNNNACEANTCSGWANTTSPITGCISVSTCVTPADTYYRCSACDTGYEADGEICAACTIGSTCATCTDPAAPYWNGTSCVACTESSQCNADYICANNTCVANPCDTAEYDEECQTCTPNGANDVTLSPKEGLCSDQHGHKNYVCQAGICTDPCNGLTTPSCQKCVAEAGEAVMIDDEDKDGTLCATNSYCSHGICEYDCSPLFKTGANPTQEECAECPTAIWYNGTCRPKCSPKRPWRADDAECYPCTSGSKSPWQNDASQCNLCTGYLFVGANQADTGPKCQLCSAQKPLAIGNNGDSATCLACGNREIDKNGKCACKPEQLLSGVKCCPPGTKPNEETSECVVDHTCEEGMYYSYDYVYTDAEGAHKGGCVPCGTDAQMTTREECLSCPGMGFSDTFRCFAPAPDDYILDNSGNLYPCDSDIISIGVIDDTQCGRCPNRFMAGNQKCTRCDLNNGIAATEEQCNLCNGLRKMSGNSCICANGTIQLDREISYPHWDTTTQQFIGTDDPVKPWVCKPVQAEP